MDLDRLESSHPDLAAGWHRLRQIIGTNTIQGELRISGMFLRLPADARDDAVDIILAVNELVKAGMVVPGYWVTDGFGMAVGPWTHPDVIPDPYRQSSMFTEYRWDSRTPAGRARFGRALETVLAKFRKFT